jgi:hypothetical protein
MIISTKELDDYINYGYDNGDKIQKINPLQMTLTSTILNSS